MTADPRAAFYLEGVDFELRGPRGPLHLYHWDCLHAGCRAGGGTADRNRVRILAVDHAATDHPKPCPDCGLALDVNARCGAGCLDHLDADPDHRDRPTSLDRFGRRNR